MQRTFLTEMPDELQANQVVVDLPRYELALARAFLRRDIARADKFSTDGEALNVVTTLNQMKTFVDELQTMDKELDVTVRVPYTNYVGLQLATTKDAVDLARRFVQRWFPTTEERLLKQKLLTLPLDKTELVWIGGDKYLGFVQAVATSPSTESLVQANQPSQQAAPQLTIEEAKAKRAEIAARRASAKNGTKGAEAQTASQETQQ